MGGKINNHEDSHIVFECREDEGHSAAVLSVVMHLFKPLVLAQYVFSVLMWLIAILVPLRFHNLFFSTPIGLDETQS